MYASPLIITSIIDVSISTVSCGSTTCTAIERPPAKTSQPDLLLLSSSGYYATATARSEGIHYTLLPLLIKLIDKIQRWDRIERHLQLPTSTEILVWHTNEGVDSRERHLSARSSEKGIISMSVFFIIIIEFVRTRKWFQF